MINITHIIETACIDLEDAIEQKDWDIVRMVYEGLDELHYDMERNSDFTEEY